MCLNFALKNLLYVCNAINLFVVFIITFQLEKAKKKEAAFIVTVAKREQEISELKVRILLMYGMRKLGQHRPHLNKSFNAFDFNFEVKVI